VLDILAAEVAGLAAYARSVVDDSGASFVLRGSAARLVLATAPEAGFAHVRAAILAARATADDPHGALAAALVAALDVLVPDVDPKSIGAAGAARTSAASQRVRSAPEAVAFATEVAIDERRPALEREAATAVLGRALAWSSQARRALGQLLAREQMGELTSVIERAVEAAVGHTHGPR